MPMPCSSRARAVPLPEEHEERAAYVLDGEVEVAGDHFEPGRMLVFRAGDRARAARRAAGRAPAAAGRRRDGRAATPVLEFRLSSRERIEQAKADWKAGAFGKVPGDETEFIPLPEERLSVRAGTQCVSEGSPTS